MQRTRIALCLTVAAIECFLSTSAVCIDSFNSLCIDVSVSGSMLVFNATCSPSPGSSAVNWCGFGFSTQALSQMFPSEIMVLQWSPTSIWLEDRNAVGGYQLPPCFPFQYSSLLSGSLDAKGVLRGTWTRVARVNSTQREEGYIDLNGTMTAIGAVSEDSAAADAICANYMVPHTFVQPGVVFSFPQ